MTDSIYGQCARCGGSLTADHKCPADPLPDYTKLAEEVAKRLGIAGSVGDDESALLADKYRLKILLSGMYGRIGIDPHSAASRLDELPKELDTFWGRTCARLFKERNDMQKSLERLTKAATAFVDPNFKDEQPKTFGCHHIDETCPHCEYIVARWKQQKALRMALEIVSQRAVPAVGTKIQSNALWPAGVCYSMYGDNISTDTHISERHAQAVCDALEKEGFGGERKHFPLRTWISEVQQPPKEPTT